MSKEAVPSHLAHLQHTFVSALLPKILEHGRIFFRRLKADHREEAVAEMTALSWAWFLRLIQRGKDPTRFPAVLAMFAALAVRAGRRLGGQGTSKDVMSPVGQRRHGFNVQYLPPGESGRDDDPLIEALRDTPGTSPAEQAAFRLDFRLWLRRRTERHRRLIEDLMVGERTQDVSRKYGISPGRVSQLRQEFYDSWQRFWGEEGGKATPAVA
jgi:hypothetical protein